MGDTNNTRKSGFYAKYLLPGVILQSVLIGGGYATGREIYQYGAHFKETDTDIEQIFHAEIGKERARAVSDCKPKEKGVSLCS